MRVCKSIREGSGGNGMLECLTVWFFIFVFPCARGVARIIIKKKKKGEVMLESSRNVHYSKLRMALSKIEVSNLSEK